MKKEFAIEFYVPVNRTHQVLFIVIIGLISLAVNL